MCKTNCILIWLFGLAIASGVVFVAIADATVVPMVARGSGPEGVQVTTSGWAALLTSALGAGGFTLAGVVTAIARMWLPSAKVTDNSVTEIVELGSAFTALMRDRTKRAAQRRFFFALVDASQLMPGVVTTHVNGVVSIQYSGFADPVAPETVKT